VFLILNFFLFFETGSCYVAKLVSGDPPASASQVLGLQT
jgi:hypothetical protein